MLQFPECLRFDLPDTLARHPKKLAHGLKRLWRRTAQAKTQAQDVFFPGAQVLQHRVHVLP